VKKFILFYSVFFILPGIMYGQWKTLNEWVDGWPQFEFVNEDIGWIAGSNSLLKTDDGGETWFSIAAEGYSGIRGIDFLNESVGWAIASQGRILKTVDGGQSWVIQKESGQPLRSLYVVNDSTTYVCGDSALILKTTDSGIIWRDISRINRYYMLNELYFFDVNTGLTWGSIDGSVSCRIFKTADGGNSWQYLPHYNYVFRGDLQFVNDSTGYIIASDISGHYKYIIETQDTCSSWSVINTFYLGNISAIKFFPGGTAYAILKENPDQAQYSLMKSTDNGVTWHTCLHFDNMRVRNIYFNTDESGFAVVGYGSDNALYKTNDGGTSWRKKKISYPFKDVFFLDQNKGFAGGGYGGFHWTLYGNLWFTGDGGNTWSKIPDHPGGYITFCSFISDTVGFTLTDGMYGSGFYKSADGGNNWNNVSINFPDSTIYYRLFINDLCFTDNQTGWAIGNFWTEDTSGAVIIKSIDGGNNWEFIWKYLDREEYHYTLHSIHSYGSNLWAVGESGLIVKYTEQDQWQILPAVTDVPLKTVFFSDEQHGWISGGYFDDENVFLKLYRTTDGGDFWEEIPDFNYSINDMFFEDSLHGWAVGGDTDYRGVLLATTDGGIRWYKQTNDLAGPLNALHFAGNYGWAVGEYGLVLKTEDKGITWIHSKSVKSYPSKFSLSQNYPNPFNPRTIINYELGIRSEMDLSVYNIVGQKVATLISEKQKAGIYQVEWDATGFASGVYLCRLTTSQGFTQTKKLVLIR